MQYTGVFLDEESHKALLDWWQSTTNEPLLDGKVFAHHMTIKFKPSKEELEATPMDAKVTLKVVGYAADTKGQAVLVEPSGIMSTNMNPHVTISTAKGVSPSYSNELISNGSMPADGPTLTGIVGAR